MAIAISYNISFYRGTYPSARYFTRSMSAFANDTFQDIWKIFRVLSVYF